jgi:predicted DNA-binding transcriptional regulator AlpA
MAPELKRTLQRRAQGGPPSPAGGDPKFIPAQHAPGRERGGVVAAPRGPPLTGRRFLSYDDLVARGIPYSRVHLRRLEISGHFPPRVELGAGNCVQTSVAWVAAEVEAWEDSRIAKRDERLQLRMKQPDTGVPAA